MGLRHRESQLRAPLTQPCCCVLTTLPSRLRPLVCGTISFTNTTPPPPSTPTPDSPQLSLAWPQMQKQPPKSPSATKALSPSHRHHGGRLLNLKGPGNNKRSACWLLGIIAPDGCRLLFSPIFRTSSSYNPARYHEAQRTPKPASYFAVQAAPHRVEDARLRDGGEAAAGHGREGHQLVQQHSA